MFFASDVFIVYFQFLAFLQNETCLIEELCPLSGRICFYVGLIETNCDAKKEIAISPVDPDPASA